MCKRLVYGFCEVAARILLTIIWIMCWVIDESCKWLYMGLREVLGEIIETYAYILRIAYEALIRVLNRFDR